MHITLYEASVPVFSRYLGNLADIVSLARSHAAGAGIDASSVLEASLFPSMYAFATQVEIAAQFSLRTCAPLAGLAVPAHGEHARSFEELETRIDRALAFLGALTPEQMDGAANRAVRSQAGQEEVCMPGRVFLLQYALPNFFFHVTAAYCILRRLGVPVGKGDYDGFHVYEAAPY